MNLLNNDYIIIKYTSTHFKDVIKLYHSSYVGRRLPRKYFKYRLGKTSSGSPIIYLMKFKDDIVGFYAIQPIRIKVGNRYLLAGYSYLTMTHPEHTGKGIFTKLATITYKEASKKGYHFIYGFANKNSFPIFVNKLGFKHLSPINFIKITQKESDTKIKLKSYYPRESIKIWDECQNKNQFKVCVYRDYKFLSWRYAHQPIFRYYTHYEKGKGIIVLKKYGDVLHIIDFFGEDKYMQENLINIARAYCTKLLCKEITLWIPPGHPVIENLPKKDFNNIEWNKSFFVVRILDRSTSKDVLDIKNWYYTMGDADHF